MHTLRRLTTLALTFIGLFDAIYLWWAYTSPSHPLLCVVGAGCDAVRASSYAHLWGLPLPSYGTAMYGVLAVLCFAEVLSGKLLGEVIRFLILIIAAGGVIASALLSGIEAFRLHAWCAWCVLSAIVVTLIFFLAIAGVRRPSLPPESLAALNTVRAQFALFLVALVVGILAFDQLSGSGEFAPARPAATAVLDQRLVRPDSHLTGNLQSPVTVVEFGDFECPICKLAQGVIEQMLNQYGTRIRFVFRQFPMSSEDPHMHPEAEKAGEASECAAEQGKFWQADQLFYQKQPNLSVPDLESYASELGLNSSQFNQCLTSGAMASRVHNDFEDGWAVGVRATPTFFVGHQMISGAPTFATLSQLLDSQLAGNGVAAAQAGSASPSETSLNSNGTQHSSSHPASSSSSAAGAGTIGVESPFPQLQQSNPLACSANEANMPQPTLIRTPEARKLFNSTPKPVFVDVREPNEFAVGHIAGAINIPVEQIEQMWSSLSKDQIIVVYEGGERGGSADDVCAFSRAAARVLFLHGFDKAKVKVYQDGLKGWESAGLAVAR